MFSTSCIVYVGVPAEATAVFPDVGREGKWGVILMLRSLALATHVEIISEFIRQ